MVEGVNKSEVARRTLERKTYTLEDGLQVAVSAEKFPSEKMTKPDQVVIFLPGWAVGEGSLSTTEITQELANAARADAYRIITRADQVVPDSLLREAEAIRRFINEIKDMVKENPRAKELQCPVVVIIGAKDRAVSHKRVASIRKYPNYNVYDLDTRHINIEASRETSLWRIFPKAASVHFVVPKEFGNHGQPLFRSRAEARQAMKPLS